MKPSVHTDKPSVAGLLEAFPQDYTRNKHEPPFSETVGSIVGLAVGVPSVHAWATVGFSARVQP